MDNAVRRFTGHLAWTEEYKEGVFAYQGRNCLTIHGLTRLRRVSARFARLQLVPPLCRFPKLVPTPQHQVSPCRRYWWWTTNPQ
jgi:hypothetical protein